MFLCVSLIAYLEEEHHIVSKRIFCLKMLIFGINYIVYCISVL